MVALRVNEVAVNLYSPREAANWWALYRAHGPAERFTTVTAAIPGDLVDVACEGSDDAEWLRDLLIERGIPRTALKILKS
ncbi:hypothetical protein GCM10010317_077510 [Streptomyces mirabilis]|uniref:hypothetical protein n=1 Tax=Streptomyces mirabilis TaxID=68239 RepID=UPI00167E8D7A|nr:hypothetical protein [Streptomyces mirabilis]GHD70354.1 hypothetical protein GCM10010317_077510 [Streptomyces mirabilis]